MSNKNNLSSRRFAISYVLGMSIVAGLVSRVIWFLMKLVNLTGMEGVAGFGVRLVIWLFAVWVGTVVVCWYLSGNYKVDNKNKILNSALNFFAGFYIVVQGFIIFVASNNPAIELSGFYLLYAIVLFFFAASLVYYLGNRYIKKQD